MPDQANELRKLVLRAARQRAASATPAPKLVAVLGSTQGVGTTTVTLNLALALGQLGVRAVLVDANLLHPSLGATCDIRDTHGIADVLSARRDIHEVLQRGPGGLQVVPGVASTEPCPAVDAAGEKRLVQQIQALGPFTDFVVADLGHLANPLARPFWNVATATLLVTSCDPAAIVETYAAIKGLADGPPHGPIRLLVNRAGTLDAAQDVADKLDRSCRKFLGQGCRLIGSLRVDPQLAGSQLAGSAVRVEAALLARPPSDAAQVIQALASELMTTGENGMGRVGTVAA